MIEFINLKFEGVPQMKDVYFTLKEQNAKETKADFRILQALCNQNSLAVNISISNQSKKPFSLLHLFLVQQGVEHEACLIREVKTKPIDFGIAYIDFKTDGGDFRYDSEQIGNITSFPTFDYHAYLLENQAETGWVIFRLPPTALLVNKLGLKISGTAETLFAVSC